MPARPCMTDACVLARWLKVAAIAGPISGALLTTLSLAGFIDLPAKKGDLDVAAQNVALIKQQIIAVQQKIDVLDKNIAVLTETLRWMRYEKEQRKPKIDGWDVVR